MNERHWALISEKVGFDCTPKGAETTFSNIYPLLMKHVGFIVDIGEKAAKEYNIEIMLNEMANIWDTINFNLLNYKDTYIIKGYDDIQMVLDEHIVST
jgi:dynein heavy chain